MQALQQQMALQINLAEVRESEQVLFPLPPATGVSLLVLGLGMPQPKLLSVTP